MSKPRSYWKKLVLVAAGILVAVAIPVYLFGEGLAYVFTVGLPIGWEPSYKGQHLVSCDYAAHNFDKSYASRPPEATCEVSCYWFYANSRGFPFTHIRVGNQWGGPKFGDYCGPETNRLAIALNWTVGAAFAAGIATLILQRKYRRRS